MEIFMEATGIMKAAKAVGDGGGGPSDGRSGSAWFLQPDEAVLRPLLVEGSQAGAPERTTPSTDREGDGRKGSALGFEISPETEFTLILPRRQIAIGEERTQ